MSQTVTRAEYARMHNVSKAAVTQWAAAGRIKIADDGNVDVEASNQMLTESAGASRGGKRARGSVGGVQSGTGSLLDARTGLATIAMKRAEAEYNVRMGELVERARYSKALSDSLAPILAAIDSVSAVKGPDLAAETDVRKFQNMLDDALADMRRDIESTLLRLIAGPDTVRQ